MLDEYWDKRIKEAELLKKLNNENLRLVLKNPDTDFEDLKRGEGIVCCAGPQTDLFNFYSKKSLILSCPYCSHAATSQFNEFNEHTNSLKTSLICKKCGWFFTLLNGKFKFYERVAYYGNFVPPSVIQMGINFGQRPTT